MAVCEGWAEPSFEREERLCNEAPSPGAADTAPFFSIAGLFGEGFALLLEAVAILEGSLEGAADWRGQWGEEATDLLAVLGVSQGDGGRAEGDQEAAAVARRLEGG